MYEIVSKSLVLIFVLCCVSICMTSSSTSSKAHSRQKRILWITDDGRLALPPGTTLIISPSLSMPFVRYPPDGFFSNMTISLPFTIDFNKLGLTDNQNPYGVIPPLLARSMGRAAGNLLASYVKDLLSKRRKRDVNSPLTAPPEHLKHAFHGGERAILYTVVEDFLTNFGMDGKACLLRAICEVNAHPLHNFGLIGEMLKLFFSASKSPYSDYMDEYVEAEQTGGNSGECWTYLKQCPKSLFANAHSLYSKNSNENIDNVENNLKMETKESDTTITIDENQLNSQSNVKNM